MHRRYAPGRQNERENDTLVTITNDRSEVLARHRRHERGLEPVKNYWLVFSLSAALAGCGPSHQQPRVVAVPQSVQAPTAPTNVQVPAVNQSVQTPTEPLSGRRIVYDHSAGLFILPDGSTAAAEPQGGFTLPNGTQAAPDGAGGLILPNGARCNSDGSRGYICP